jgi:hypothetical protein
MSATIPADTQVANAGNPVADLNNTYDVLGLLAEIVAAMNGAPDTAYPAGNAANISAIQASLSAHVPGQGGLQFLTGGGNITATTISNAIAAGYSGIFLDPRYVWNAAGLVIFGVSNFIIESRMSGSIGWNGAITYGPGYIGTGSGADGVQIFGYTGNETAGITFRGCSFVGANTNAVVHFGGRQRHCRMEKCFIYNTNATSGAYGLIVDSGLTGAGAFPTSMNSEDQAFTSMDIAGAYAALGIGIGDTGQHANDTIWYDLTTAGGTYGIVNTAGSNHSFHNYYDRSSPSIATVYNSGNTLFFYGGEDLNGAAGGVAHLLDNSTAATILVNRTISTGANTSTVTISAGNLMARGRCRWSGTLNLSGTGNVDLSDPGGSYSALTISGSAAGATVMLAGSYNPGTGPILSSWTGSLLIQGPIVVGTKSGTGQTSAQSLTWNPPSLNCEFRVSVMIHPTVAGTSTVPVLTFTELGGGAFSQTIPMWQQNSAATTPSYLCAATSTFVGSFTSKTDNSGTQVKLTITPTGSTYRYAILIEQLSAS